MAERIWDKFWTERDKKVVGAAGYAARGGFGKRPALAVIDVNYAFCGDKPEPILESIKRWRDSCGEDAWTGIAVIKKLLDACHAKGVPVIYTSRKIREDNWDAGGWLFKNSRYREDPPQDSKLDPHAIVAPIAPAPQDILIYKQTPSPFHSTPLQSYLTLLGCDSLIVTGTTTSGCVRATVIDAFAANYRIIIAEDGCFDRTQASNAINLYDMNAKYADVIGSSEILAYINALPAGMFDLPKGIVHKG
jgi:maleamate amidohydrolase